MACPAAVAGVTDLAGLVHAVLFCEYLEISSAIEQWIDRDTSGVVRELAALGVLRAPTVRNEPGASLAVAVAHCRARLAFASTGGGADEIVGSLPFNRWIFGPTSGRWAH